MKKWPLFSIETPIAERVIVKDPKRIGVATYRKFFWFIFKRETK